MPANKAIVMVNLIEGRKGFNNLGNNYPAAKQVLREQFFIAGVSCVRFTPAITGSHDVIIYIHGGAFIYGSVHSHAALVSHIAAALQQQVLFIDYSLAPENPFPAGLNDCIKVITAYTSKHKDSAFGLMGDSAGGNLVMAAQLQLLAQAGLQPLYNVVMSPWVDLECKNPSYEINKNLDSILAQDYLKQAAGMYAGNKQLSHPLLSPINADFTNTAPTLVMAGTSEILQDDAILLHRKIQSAGVHAVLHLFENEQHVWLFNDINTSTSQDALKLMKEFIRTQQNKD